MMSLGWSVPSHRVDAATAKRRILSQHERIRALLLRARAVAEASLDGTPLPPGAIADAIDDICTIIDVHLAFEESVWLPVLRLDDLMLGAEGRADKLITDHQNQRAMLSALYREARAFPQLPILAAKLAFLTSWLAADMREEERALLT
jgi:hemerythrin HHE cation binding domain-containing protein